jgi:hypothetical protein
MSTLRRAILYLVGIPMWILAIYWFAEWWGTGGVLAAVFLAPLAAVFPFIYLLEEGFDSGAFLYLGLWAVGLVGLMFVGAIIDTERRSSDLPTGGYLG